jgi:hypothetical protein
MKAEFWKLFDEKTEEITTLKNTINELVYLRENKRTTFSLDFD